MKFVIATVMSLAAVSVSAFEDVSISNGIVEARLYLPESNFYKGTRFDKSAIIHSLKFKGHEYFGLWLPKPEPARHDSICGPVDEFGQIGYEVAPVGGYFFKIGVGVLCRAENIDYNMRTTYEVVDSGRWVVETFKDKVEYTHYLNSREGYAYVYKKTVRLEKDSPRLVIERSIINKGSKRITTTSYPHNFFMLDGAQTGPDIKMTSANKLTSGIKGAGFNEGYATFDGKNLSFLKKLDDVQRVMISDYVGKNSVADYDFKLENTATGAGVRISGNKPLLKFVFWASNKCACPEPYVLIDIDSGESYSWTTFYDFYTTK